MSRLKDFRAAVMLAQPNTVGDMLLMLDRHVKCESAGKVVPKAKVVQCKPMTNKEVEVAFGEVFRSCLSKKRNK